MVSQALEVDLHLRGTTVRINAVGVHVLISTHLGRIARQNAESIRRIRARRPGATIAPSSAADVFLLYAMVENAYGPLLAAMAVLGAGRTRSKDARKRVPAMVTVAAHLLDIPIHEHALPFSMFPELVVRWLCKRVRIEGFTDDVRHRFIGNGQTGDSGRDQQTENPEQGGGKPRPYMRS